MLKLEEIQKIEINIDIVQDGLKFAEQKLTDVLQTKESLDQKAFSLLRAYVLILGLSCLSIYYLCANGLFDSNLFYAFSAILSSIMIGILCLSCSICALKYGTQGRSPDTYLQPDILDGNERVRATVLGYILHGYQKRIGASCQSNEKKSKLINLGIFFGAILSTSCFLASVLLLSKNII